MQAEPRTFPDLPVCSKAQMNVLTKPGINKNATVSIHWRSETAVSVWTKYGPNIWLIAVEMLTTVATADR